MKTLIKYAAVAVVALGVSGVADTMANANTTPVSQLRQQLKQTLFTLVRNLDLQLNALDKQIAAATTRTETVNLLKQRRVLLTERNRLRSREKAVDRWTGSQVVWFAAIYPAVSGS